MWCHLAQHESSVPTFPHGGSLQDCLEWYRQLSMNMQPAGGAYDDAPFSLNFNKALTRP